MSAVDNEGKWQNVDWFWAITSHSCPTDYLLKNSQRVFKTLLVVKIIRRIYSSLSLQCSCLENSMDGGAWWAAVHGVVKSQTRLSDFTFTFHLHALEKEMAAHSSVLAWRIPGTGESGGLLSMGSHRVRHDWSDLAAAAATVHTENSKKLHPIETVSAHSEKGPASKGRNTVTWEEYLIKRGEKKKILVYRFLVKRGRKDN